MNRPIYLLGGGGHGKVLIDTMQQLKVSLAGILDPNLEVGRQIQGVEVLGRDELLKTMNPAEILLVNGVGANPKVGLRQNLFEDLKSRGFWFASVVSVSAIQASGIELEEGSQILAGVVMQPGVHLGENAVINTGARIDHDSRIGAHSFIAPGATLCGNVYVGESSFIGAGAILLPGVRIGQGAIVGAGSVVTKSVSDGWIVVGNPARKMGEQEC